MHILARLIARLFRRRPASPITSPMEPSEVLTEEALAHLRSVRGGMKVRPGERIFFALHSNGRVRILDGIRWN